MNMNTYTTVCRDCSLSGPLVLDDLLHQVRGDAYILRIVSIDGYIDLSFGSARKPLCIYVCICVKI